MLGCVAVRVVLGAERTCLASFLVRSDDVFCGPWVVMFMVVRSYSVLALQLERFFQFSRDSTGGVTSFVEALSFPQCCFVRVAFHAGRIWCTISQITCPWTWWTVGPHVASTDVQWYDCYVSMSQQGGESCEPIFGFTGRYLIDFSDEDWIYLKKKNVSYSCKHLYYG